MIFTLILGSGYNCNLDPNPDLNPNWLCRKGG